MLRHLNVRSRLILMMLATSIISILVVGYQGYRSGRDALRQSAYNHLTSQRQSKSLLLEEFCNQTRRQVEVLCSDPMVADAMREFRVSFRQLFIEELDLSEEKEQKIRDFYKDDFLPAYERATNNRFRTELFVPYKQEALYLQAHYIGSNPHPVGQKEMLQKADDESYYSVVHERFHPIFRKIKERFKYHDLFLIDKENGHIVYSVTKEPDFATTLETGPYQESNLADVFRAVQRNTTPDALQLVDFESYAPSRGAPSAFVAGPIYDKLECVGILAIQIPIEQIDRVMTSQKNWEQEGLGESGEVYVVGSDFQMRNNSRFFLQDREKYLQLMEDINYPLERREEIERYGTTVLTQEVRTVPAEAALRGSTGSMIATDYRNVSCLSSYGPANIPGLNWIILAEMDEWEAFHPSNQFLKEVTISAAIQALVISLIALYLSYLFLRPVQQLIGGVRRLAKGEKAVEIPVRSGDEFSELGRSFNMMTSAIEVKDIMLKQKDEENEALLLNILPAPIVERMKKGEVDIADRYDQVAVIYTSLRGFDVNADEKGGGNAELLTRVIHDMDRIIEDCRMEKIKTIGSNYLAVCGLTVPRLDSVERTLECAQQLIGCVDRFNSTYQTDLVIRVAVHYGDVFAGVVGRKQFVYDLWGPTVSFASRLRYEAPVGGIAISRQVRERVNDCVAGFEPGTGFEWNEQMREVWAWQDPDFDIKHSSVLQESDRQITED